MNGTLLTRLIAADDKLYRNLIVIAGTTILVHVCIWNSMSPSANPPPPDSPPPIMSFDKPEPIEEQPIIKVEQPSEPEPVVETKDPRFEFDLIQDLDSMRKTK